MKSFVTCQLRHHDGWKSGWTAITRLGLTVLVFICGLLASTVAALAQQPARDLTDKSIEELMSVEVTSVSRKEQRLFRTAAAVYVITQEDIQRSGLSSIPELLRLVPGLNVARINANSWAVSARGFNGEFSNKMQVLIDGRSVYSPLFSGVYWDVQDLVLEDIERIEVIRGPGAAIWGVNAVNGVINIITKSAGSTQGGLVTIQSGNEDYGVGAIQYGGKIGGRAFYRVYSKYSDRSGLDNSSGQETPDAWRTLHGGFRLDWQASDRDSVRFEGDLYNATSGYQGPHLDSFLPQVAQTTNNRADSAGGNISARWDRVISARSDFDLQFYYDHTRRDDVSLGETRDTVDFDFTNHILWGKRQEIVWGAGYRFTTDRLRNSFGVSLNPASLGQHLASAFVQDEIRLIENRLRLTVGSKFEHATIGGFVAQPTIRLAWTPTVRQTLWAAVSRAVRTPSQSETGIQIDLAAIAGRNNSTSLLAIVGNPGLQSENLVAYELGYRIQPAKRFWLDVATFYNIYQNLVSVESSQPFFQADPFPPHLVIPLRIGNKMNGTTYGAELSANWSVINCWKLSAGYSWLRLQMHPGSTSNDVTSFQQVDGDSPHQQAQLQSNLKLPRNFTFDTSLFYVDKLNFGGIPSYTRVDAQLGWRLSESFDLSLGGQNLLDQRHQEFRDAQSLNATEIKRSAFGKLTWRF